jgi:hypothetical protein
VGSAKFGWSGSQNLGYSNRAEGLAAGFASIPALPSMLGLKESMLGDITRRLASQSDDIRRKDNTAPCLPYKSYGPHSIFHCLSWPYIISYQ